MSDSNIQITIKNWQTDKISSIEHYKLERELKKNIILINDIIDFKRQNIWVYCGYSRSCNYYNYCYMYMYKYTCNKLMVHVNYFLIWIKVLVLFWIDYNRYNWLYIKLSSADIYQINLESLFNVKKFLYLFSNVSKVFSLCFCNFGHSRRKWILFSILVVHDLQTLRSIGVFWYLPPSTSKQFLQYSTSSTRFQHF